MTAAEHIEEAEKALASDNAPWEQSATRLARAQVHATLALAVATDDLAATATAAYELDRLRAQDTGTLR